MKPDSDDMPGDRLAMDRGTTSYLTPASFGALGLTERISIHAAKKKNGTPAGGKRKGPRKGRPAGKGKNGTPAPKKR